MRFPSLIVAHMTEIDMKHYLFLAFVLILVGCNQEFDDISSEQKYSKYINNKYQLIEDLTLLSVSPDKDKKIGFYMLDTSKTVTHTSPEVMARHTLSSGSLIEISKVLKCNNCVFGAPIKFSVNIIGNRALPNHPVYLSFALKEDLEEEHFLWLQPK